MESLDFLGNAANRPRLSGRRKAARKELDPLVGGEKREAYVWLYENLGASKPATAR